MMRSSTVWTVCGAVALTLASSLSARADVLAKSPLAFIANEGQFDSRAKFFVRTCGQTAWFTEAGLVFDLQRVKPGTEKPPGDVISRRLRGPLANHEAERERLVFFQEFVGAKRNVTIAGLDQQPGRYNYFLGNDPKKWRTGVRASSVVVYKDLYDGIDFKVYGKDRDLEQEFVVWPGADLNGIRIQYRGINGLRVAEDGSLVIRTAFGELQETQPQIYQEMAGLKRLAVRGRFRLDGDNAYGFEVDDYDDHLPLVIDPTLMFSTYLGGRADDGMNNVRVDGNGDSYCVGSTSSPNFPATIGVFNGGGFDAYLTKLNAAGTEPVYSAYIGGADQDYARDVAFDAAGSAYVVGSTLSSNFPTTPGAYDFSANGAHDAFIIKLDAAGENLVYGTYLGGSSADHAFGLGLDPDGSVYVCGFTVSGNFPTTLGVAQSTIGNPGSGRSDAFVTKLNPLGTARVYSTFLGGTADDYAYAMAVDSSGNVFFSGETSSRNFPTTVGALQKSLEGIGQDAFVAKLNAAGSALAYSTYLGGGDLDRAFGLCVDSSGNCYVAGFTSSGNFPTTLGALQSGFKGGQYDGFVTKINPRGSGLVFSTYLGGNGDDVINDIAVDTSRNVFVAGGTRSSNFPVSSDALQGALQGAAGSNYDAFVTKIDAIGTRLSFSTYLGRAADDSAVAIHVDECGDAHFGGYSYSQDFPTTAGSYQEVFGGGSYDGFVGHLPLGSELLATSIAAYPNQDVELPIVAKSGMPVSAIQITISSPLVFIPPADPRDLLLGTIVEAAERVQATAFGDGTFLTIGIFADFDPPFEGKTFDLCPGGVVARPRLRLGNYSQRVDLPITVHAQVGSPPRYSVFTTPEGRDFEPILTSGVLKVAGFFTRGDANSDHRVSISDIVFILRTLFAADTSLPRCSDAADANDDDRLNITDAIFLAMYLFNQGPAPPPPGGVGCGLDPTPSPLLKDCLDACP